MSTEVSGVVAENIRAVNAHDLEALIATFAADAYVNDARRQIDGIDAIRAWAEKEIIGDSVTIQPRTVTEHYGETIVRGKYDGTYDKTTIAGELIMTNYYRVVGGKVVSLTVINNRPSEYE
ncbi:MAG TPA: nuclear transport factor 2 family protein [Pseudolysinimonas sp.]|jgi:hypothetical protein